MSYILDALRRSDSERGRGSVPSIHAQPVPLFSSDTRPSYQLKPWVWIAIGLSVGLLVALGSMWFGRDAPPPRRVAGATGVVDAPTPAPAPAPVAPAAAPSPAAAPAGPPIPPPAKPRAIPASPRVPELATTTTARKSASVAPAAAAAKAPASAAASEGRILAQSELPEDIRRQLPAMAIGGSIYSAHAANRMLIVNGQLLHEGDKLAPDLTLETIKLKSAVLRFKGYRYEISY